MNNISHRIVALSAARIVRRMRGHWLGSYYVASPREAYRAVARSIRMARSGRLHGGSGPFGQGPAAWLSREF